MNKLYLTIGIIFSTFFFNSCSLDRLSNIKIPKPHLPNLPHIIGKKKNGTGKLNDTTLQNYALYPEPYINDNKSDVIPKNEINKSDLGLSSIIFSHKAYKTLAVKAKAHYEGPSDQQDFTAFIRVKKDSAIWVNIYGLGGIVNAARILITTDSFYMLNYIQKEITMLPLSDVAKVLPTKVDFPSLQNIINGDIIKEGNIEQVEKITTGWLAKVADANYIQQLNIMLGDSSIHEEIMTTTFKDGPTAILRYFDFDKVESFKLSMKREIQIKNGNDIFNLNLNYVSISINNPVEMPFNIPSGYTKK